MNLKRNELAVIVGIAVVVGASVMVSVLTNVVIFLWLFHELLHKVSQLLL